MSVVTAQPMCEDGRALALPSADPVLSMRSQWRSATYFTLKRMLNRSGVHAHYRYLRSMQARSADELHAEQARLLAELCARAARSVPAYAARFAQAGLTPGQLRTRPDLIAQLRPVLRGDIRDDQQSFLQRGATTSKLELVRTGGSGGSPLCVARDAHAKDWWLAESFLLNSWAGLDVGVPHYFLWGAADDISRTNSGLRRFNLGLLHARTVLNASKMSAEKEVAFLRELNRSPRPGFIFGYASELHNLARRSLELGPRITRPFEAIIATAEPLTAAMREDMERAFHCPVYNRYGSREAGDIASECRHQRGLHINPLFSYVEVVDDHGHTVEHGREGQLLVTNLHNRVMPLIRYAIGDRGVLRGPERCSCGVSWPTITRLTGRVNDWVFLSDGSRLRCSALESVLVELPALKRFQIHQASETSLQIRLSSLDGEYLTRRSEALEQARRKLSALSGAKLDIHFEVTDGELYKTHAGKQPLITHAAGLVQRHMSQSPSAM